MGKNTRGKGKSGNGWRNPKGQHVDVPDRPAIKGNHQIILHPQNAVIFQVLEGGRVQYTTNPIFLSMIHGLTAEGVLEDNPEQWEGFVGYVIYLRDGVYFRYPGTWNQAAEAMVKDLPGIVQLH